MLEWWLLPYHGTDMLTLERLREVLHYNQETGIWTWLISSKWNIIIGSTAGDLKPSGYILIGVDGKRYRAHRLAWLYMTGAWPTQQIDHKNTIRNDNRWLNLREATQQQNSANMLRTNNKIGTKGVIKSRNGRKFIARIMVDYKSIYLGTYDTKEKAAEVYRVAAEKYFGAYARVA